MSLLLNQPFFCVVQKPRSSPLFSNNALSTSLCVDPCRSNHGIVGDTRLDGITVTPKSSNILLPLQIICVDPCRPNLSRYVHARSERIRAIDCVTVDGFNASSEMVGSSNGWEISLRDGRLMARISNPVKERKQIRLPLLVTLPFCQTQMITNVAMSSSEEDCVVAVKFLGPQLSFCRPAQSEPEWINVRIENPSFFSSPVMFSKKDEMFHIVGSGGHLIGSWDPSGDTSEFQKLEFQNIPEISKTKQELLDTCWTSHHLVESCTTGETFMVKWYKKTAEDFENLKIGEGIECKKIGQGIESMETKAVMVFKLDEQGNAVFTQDIGDLNIFLTKSEIFCQDIRPRPFRKCRRNCVQIWDVDETTIVHLAAQEWNC